MDGKTSKRVPARLEIAKSRGGEVSLYLQGEDTAAKYLTFEHGALQINSRVGNAPRELCFPHGQLFITDDHEAVDDYIKSNRLFRFSIWLHRIETRFSAIFVVTICVIFMVWGFIAYGIPKAAQIIAHNLPVQTIGHFADILDALDNALLKQSKLDKRRREHIRLLAAPILRQHAALNPSLEFRSGMHANAFALPGGQIVFTDSLVNLLQSDEEILAILLHELGHLQRRHFLRRIVQDSMATLLVTLVFGDIESFGLITGMPVLFLDLSYSRNAETEADEYALLQLKKAGISLEHFSNAISNIDDFYQKHFKEQEANGGENTAPTTNHQLQNYLSTHPMTKDRILLIERYKRENSVLQAP